MYISVDIQLLVIYQTLKNGVYPKVALLIRKLVITHQILGFPIHYW